MGGSFQRRVGRLYNPAGQRVRIMYHSKRSASPGNWGRFARRRSQFPSQRRLEMKRGAEGGLEVEVRAVAEIQVVAYIQPQTQTAEHQFRSAARKNREVGFTSGNFPDRVGEA